MGLFQKLKRKKENRYESGTTEQKERIALADSNEYKNPENRRSFLQDNCEVVQEANRQNLDIKKEYEVVTAYLSDMQRIDLLPKNVKAKIEDCAKKIINLNAERIKMQKIPSKITQTQRNALQPYEATMPEEIRKMEEYEKNQLLINSYLRQLESEKAVLEYEIRDIVERTGLEKKLMIFSGIFCSCAACILLILQEFLNKKVQLPFLLMVTAGIISIGYFVLSRRKYSFRLKMAEKKANRVIYLLNKVGIKYVNCTGVLDYTCEKFHVNNSKELQYHWQEYMRLLEEERRFKKADELIDFYNNELIQELKGLEITDAGIWVYQCEALLDSKEMVEVRHRLNVRRQKLRKQIDYNNEQMNRAKRTLYSFMAKYPEYVMETKDIMRRYEIE